VTPLYALSAAQPLAVSPTWIMLPAALRRSADLYRATVTITDAVGNRSSSRYLATPGPLTLTPPPALAVSVAAPTTPCPQPSFTFTATPSTQPLQRYAASGSATPSGRQYSWSAEVTGGWLAGQTAVVYTMPTSARSTAGSPSTSPSRPPPRCPGSSAAPTPSVWPSSTAPSSRPPPSLDRAVTAAATLSRDRDSRSGAR